MQTIQRMGLAATQHGIQRAAKPTLQFRNFLPTQRALLPQPFQVMLQQRGFSTEAAPEEGKREPTIQERIQASIQLIRRVQRTEPIRYMCQDSVPIDLEGSMLLPVIPERELITEYFEEKEISRDVLYPHLFDMLQDFMEGLQAQDYDRLSKFTEERFLTKLKEKADERDQNNWFEFGRTSYDPEKVICIDKLFVKGVGVDRSTNEDQMDYRKVTALESFGLRQYVHKYDLGMQDYYYMKRWGKEIHNLADAEWRQKNPEECYKADRAVREGWHKLRTEILAKQFRYLLRVTLQIKDGGMGSFTYDKGVERQERGLVADTYANENNHIAIFECQLKQPPIMSLENHTHKEFLYASRLNFVHWKLVDVDNYMGGNKPFTEEDIENPQEKFQAKVDELLNKPDKRELRKEPMNSKTKDAMFRSINENLRWLDDFEPNSNAKVGLDNITQEKAKPAAAAAPEGGKKAGKKEKKAKQEASSEAEEPAPKKEGKKQKAEE